MAGLTRQTPLPTSIVVHRRSRVLEVVFDDGTQARLPFEFLRVLSPSAEVRGHGPGQEVLQVGKRDVDLEALEPVGNYAVQPRFSDGHDTGIYSWDYLHHLASRQEALWSDYLARLAAAGASRDPAPATVATGPSGSAATPVRVSGGERSPADQRTVAASGAASAASSAASPAAASDPASDPAASATRPEPPARLTAVDLRRQRS